MALQKQPVQMNFGGGLDTKTDPAQVQLGKFLSLENVVFNQGRLQKRNGFARLTALPDTNSTTLTTLNGNLLATGTQLRAYSEDSQEWLAQGLVQPVDLSVKALVRTAVSQSQADCASANGLTCTAYTESSTLYYQITDTSTGQIILDRLAVGSTAVNGRVFALSQYFIITFMQTVTATATLRYIAIPLSDPTSPIAVADISTNVASITTGYDGVVASDTLYLAWGGSSTTFKMAFLNNRLQVSTEASYSSSTADVVAVAADTTGSTPVIWAAFYQTSTTTAKVVARDSTLSMGILAATTVLSTGTVPCMTMTAKNGTATLSWQVENTVSALNSTRQDYVMQRTIDTAGTLGTATTLLRGVGLASKAFLNNGDGYVLLAYNGSYQPTYFLSDYSGNVVMKLAYSNGAGYVAGQLLPSVTSNGSTFSVVYLLKTLLSSVNKSVGAQAVAGIYSQTGVNLATFTINDRGQASVEAANSLQLTGGITWQYDGKKPVELGFHVYPEDIKVTTATGSGNLTAQTYYYSFCYEWTDGTGKLHRSAPSVPVSIVTTTASSTNTINVATLRQTYKTGANAVRIVGYRWSTAYQNFYQFTSISSPTLNDTSVDYVTFTDTLADSSIIGNNLLYTTGGVLENIAPPAAVAVTVWKNRVWLLTAEDRNLCWYSKPIIQGVPVEFTDLQTLYVAPSTSTQGTAGESTALAPLDDKLIIFKEGSAYYVSGTGPDVTGANNDFSDAIFITSAVGCSNSPSIVNMPSGLMFQSKKGIWLLGRDLSTSYIGADVETFNSSEVNGSVSIPSQNQVRFSLDSGAVLMYDYYYQQWCSFTNIPAISSCLYQNAHTILNSRGIVQQEGAAYLDESRPVLIKFTTAWVKLTGLQGYQRAYFMYLLGTYSAAHRLNVSVAYDYDDSAIQTTLLLPLNADDTWGSDPLWGGSALWGGGSNVEQYRLFFERQRCQAVQITLQEVYDSSDGNAGAGIALSSLNFVIGAKKGYPTLPAAQSKG